MLLKFIYVDCQKAINYATYVYLHLIVYRPSIYTLYFTINNNYKVSCL